MAEAAAGRRWTKGRIAILAALVVGVCLFPGIRIVTALGALELAAETDAGPRLLDCMAAGEAPCHDRFYDGQRLELDGEPALVARGARGPVYGDLWVQVGDERLHCYSVVGEARRLRFVPGFLSGAGEVQDPDPRCTEALVGIYRP